MIDHDSAVKLVASFSALPYFHTVTKEGLAVMVQTVEHAAHDGASNGVPNQHRPLNPNSVHEADQVPMLTRAMS